MRVPKGCYLVKSLEVYPGKQVMGLVIQIGEKYTIEGDEWKKDRVDENDPKVGDKVVYSLDWGTVDLMLDNTLHHIIGTPKIIL